MPLILGVDCERTLRGLHRSLIPSLSGNAVLVDVRSPRILAAVVVAALVGAGGGAGAYALFNSDSGTTVVRQVHVTQSLQAANNSGSALSVGSIYKLAYKGVVKILVSSSGGNFSLNGQ